jgi:Phospholipid methyltransferase
MHSLELKVPPPVIAVLVAAAMWGIAKVGVPIETPDLVRHVVAAAIALAGGCVSLAGIVSFRRARTTVNPLKPQNTSALVTADIFRYARKPMYLGQCNICTAGHPGFIRIAIGGSHLNLIRTHDGHPARDGVLRCDAVNLTIVNTMFML